MENNAQNSCLCSNIQNNNVKKDYKNMSKISTDKVCSKGVSMITLVITIVVLLIIAGISMYYSSKSISDATLSAFSQELKDIEQMTAATRISNKTSGISEEIVNRGFYKAYISNPPKDFICFVDESDASRRLYGYVINFDTIKYEKGKRGKDYKEYSSDNKTVEFGKDDVYMYDAEGKVFYVKGFTTDKGTYHVVTEADLDGPNIVRVSKTISPDKKSVKITVKVKAQKDGELTCKLEQKDMKKESVNGNEATFTLTVRENKTFKIYANESNNGITSSVVSVSEIDAKTFEITYNENSEKSLVSNMPSESTLKTEGVPTFLATEIPNKKDFTFLGWGISPSDTTATYKAGDEFNVDSDMELYAIWGKNERTYSIYYIANGGINAPEGVSNVAGDTAISTQIPSKEGYGFDGWSENSKAINGEEKYNPGNIIAIDKNITLYAIWKKDMYTVLVKTAIKEANGTVRDADLLMENPGQVSGKGARAEGNKVTLNATTNPGYIFDGWKINSGNITTSGNENITYFTMPKHNVSITAVFTRAGAIVKYNANGGVGVPEAETVEVGKKIFITPMTPTRTGYDFLGWGLKNTDATATYIAGEEYIVNKSVTFYAIWMPHKKTYQVVYDLNGGQKNGKDFSTITRVEGDSILENGIVSYPIITRNIPFKEGYKFYGWTTAKNATNVVYRGGEEYKEEKSIILYAIWKDEDAPTKLRIVPVQSGDNLYLKASGYDGGNIFGYAWSKTVEMPNEFISVDSSEATGIGTKNVEIIKKITEKGTYYIWFKDSNNNISNISLEVYEILFNNNSGIGGPTKQFKAQGNASTKLTNKIPSKSNHVFIGWSTKSAPDLNDYSQVIYKPEDKYYQNSDIKLSAVWGECDFTLSSMRGESSINGQDIVIMVNKNAYTGNLTIKVDDESVATAREESNIITISPKEKVGSTVITITEDNLKIERKFTMIVNKGERVAVLSDNKKAYTYGNSSSVIMYNYIGNEVTTSVSTTNSTVATAKIEGNNIVITPRNVGNANIILTIEADEQYTKKEEIISVKVDKRKLYVKPKDNQSKVYDNTSNTPLLTYEWIGALQGETPAFNGNLTRDPGKNVGRYVIREGTLSLKDNGSFKAANYELEYDSENIYFNIVPLFVDLPIAKEDQIFDGTVKYGIEDGNLYDRAGQYYATKAGEYIATVKLKDTLNYLWKDINTNKPQNINWSISTNTGITCEDIAEYVYTGKEIIPEINVKAGNKNLTANVDYIATYKNNINAGIADVTITGIGNYENAVIYESFRIKNANMTVNSNGYSGMYDGNDHTINVRTTWPDYGATIYYATSPLNDDNYLVGSTTKPSYKDKIDTTIYYYITATNFNPYKGSLKINITAKSIETGLKITNIKNTNFNGTYQTQNPILTDTEISKVLVEGKDYETAYKNNFNSGVATITFTGKGNYLGTTSRTFTINSDRITLNKNTNDLVNKVTIRASNEISICKIEYNIDGGTWKNYTGPFDITNNATINARSVYNGTTIASSSLVVNNICLHNFQNRTCVQDKKCIICGCVAETARGHNYVSQVTTSTYIRTNANCTEAATYYYKCDWCSSKGSEYYSSGMPLGHNYNEATCTTPKTCIRCNQTTGTALEHSFIPATCTTPEICTICGKVQGSELGHNYITNADGKRICTRCGKMEK